LGVSRRDAALIDATVAVVVHLVTLLQSTGARTSFVVIAVPRTGRETVPINIQFGLQHCSTAVIV
jgi:hypothetical protein